MAGTGAPFKLSTESKNNAQCVAISGEIITQERGAFQTCGEDEDGRKGARKIFPLADLND